MSIGEFDLIARHFTRPSRRDDVVVGVGDDCAVLSVPPGHELAVSIDTLVAGRHFPVQTPPADIARKAVAVNVSDLAAMGATPAWMTLALTLPERDEAWLSAFAAGLFQALDEHGMSLVGGDTTRGPLTLSLQAHGLVPAGRALRRTGARPGDRVVVSGTPGDAGYGLKLALGQATATGADAGYLRARLDRPTPRVALGLALRGLASAAIDVSDGLAQDLSHILAGSGVGAELALERLPVSPALARVCAAPEAERLALAGGDDYELCFTVPAGAEPELPRLAQEAGVALTVIGTITATPGLRLFRNGQAVTLDASGFSHF